MEKPPHQITIHQIITPYYLVGMTPTTNSEKLDSAVKRVEIEQCAYCGAILRANDVPLETYRRHYDGECIEDGESYEERERKNL